MIRPRRKIEFVVVAVFLLCAWLLFDHQFDGLSRRFVGESIAEQPWRYGTTEPEEKHAAPKQEE